MLLFFSCIKNLYNITFAKHNVYNTMKIIQNYLMNMFKVEKDVPVPDSGRGRKASYELPDMEVGDSFFIEGETSKYLARLFYQKKKKKYKLTARTMENGVRIWRVK